MPSPRARRGRTIRSRTAAGTGRCLAGSRRRCPPCRGSGRRVVARGDRPPAPPRRAPARLPPARASPGDGPERDAAEQEVDHLALRRDVRFLGKVDNVAEILRGSDLFLLPSETESFGLAALEAMACAVPVIATAVGGLPEVVVPGETGFLTPTGDVEAMIAHGLRVLRDDALQARMREAAARRALEFTADRIVPRYEQVYEDLLRD